MASIRAVIAHAQLGANATTGTTSGASGNIYWADASAVMHVDAARLFAAAQDYDHYVAFGMPHLNESHVVERDSPEVLFTWASMSIATLHSQHYLEVHVHPSLESAGDAAGSRGMEWQLASKRPEWPYTEAPGVHPQRRIILHPTRYRMERFYVRYYLSNDLDNPLGGLLSGLIKTQLRKGAADVIHAHARQAPAPALDRALY